MHTIAACEYYRYYLLPWLLNCGFCRSYLNSLRRVGKGKGKAVPLQAWTGPEDSRRVRLPDFKTIGT